MADNFSNDYSLTNYSSSEGQFSKATLQSAAKKAFATIRATWMTSAGYDSYTIVLTDTSGLSKTYLFDDDNDGATGTLDGEGRVRVQLNGLSDARTILAQLGAAIESGNGHNGSIITEALPSVWSLSLSQSVAGEAGNTSIGGTYIFDGTYSFINGSTSGTSRDQFMSGSEDLYVESSLGGAAPFRVSTKGAPNIRLQNSSKYYQTFIGEDKV